MNALGLQAGTSLNDVTVQVLGMTNNSVTWDQSSASWSGLSSSSSGLNALVPLSSGSAITQIESGSSGVVGNFINWNRQSNIIIVGHMVVTVNTVNQVKMIDVTEYVESVLASGGTTLTFLFYRPFRNPGYMTGSLPRSINSDESIYYVVI